MAEEEEVLGGIFQAHSPAVCMVLRLQTKERKKNIQLQGTRHIPSDCTVIPAKLSFLKSKWFLLKAVFPLPREIYHRRFLIFTSP